MTLCMIPRSRNAVNHYDTHRYMFTITSASLSVVVRLSEGACNIHLIDLHWLQFR